MHLSPDFINEIKNTLLEKKGQLESELERLAKPTSVPGEYETTFDNIGTAEDENASEVEEYADNLALESNLENQLKEINEALEKIESETYGYCENCKQPISIERLKAYPAAKNCVQCK
ncbi:MAG: transcriptional regulator, TraR/DksA family [uncultured bacterium]|nr:MAG: transcriptional regulator, TraR/DksA family [uncultured bacterium]HBR71230.1 hypothetical protein [Candidatus Moranbacteria bacterium]